MLTSDGRDEEMTSRGSRLRSPCRIRASSDISMRAVPATRGDLSRSAGTVEISPFGVRLVVRREQAVGGDRGGQLTGQHGVAPLVPDAAYAGRVAQPLVELVAHQRPGEVELLLGALVGQAAGAEVFAVPEHAAPQVVDTDVVQPGHGDHRRGP